MGAAPLVTHYSQDQLQDFVRGRLSADESEAVEAHLAECEECGRVLEGLDRASDPFLDGVEMATSAAGSGDAARLAVTEPVASAEAAGQRIGPYKLLERIGEGGMGIVWVADQKEPVRRRVALKVIKPGMDSRQVVARFEAERQALAMMDHPNIARVLDGGITETHQPYFVMELVNGLPLTKFCDDAKLTPRERLDLFVPICQAVQHAHQKGIVHRDLKPSNILVTLYDGRPVPKVIDFGVAKATGGKLTDETFATQFGAVIGTFEYMAPEQAGFSARDVDTRADIYSLGVILYELLTGLRPIDAKRLQRVAIHEMIRILQEEEPSRPSTRLSTDESLPSLAALRQTEPKRLMSLLRGELDWVVMKCLAKERERRYETASGLARDIQRYLADEPVEARPPSAGYRFRKFLRRNRGPVIAATILLVVLFGGIVGTTWGMFRAKWAQRAAEQAGQRETEQRQVAQQNERAAQTERDAAQAARDNLRAALYAADMNLVQAAWNKDDVAGADAILQRWRPQAGEPDLRGFEWHYWDRELHSELSTVRVAESLTTRAVLASSGTRIADLVRGDGEHGVLKVWDTATSREVAAIPVAGAFAPDIDPIVALSPDGKLAAMTFNPFATLGQKSIESRPRSLLAWQVADGAEVLSIEAALLPVFSRSAGPIFSPDGTRVVVGTHRSAKDAPTFDPKTAGMEFQFWGLAMKQRSHTIAAGTGSFAAFSADGQRLAIGGKGVLRVLKAEDGEQVVAIPLPGHVQSVALSYDGSLAAAQMHVTTAEGVSGQGSAWDVATGKLNCSVRTTLYNATATEFSSDGKLVLFGESVAFEGSNRLQPGHAIQARIKPLLLIDVESGAIRQQIKGLTNYLFAFGSRADRLITANNDGRVRTWKIKPPGGPFDSGEYLRSGDNSSVHPHLPRVAVIMAGKTPTHAGTSVRVADFQNRTVFTTLEHEQPINRVRYCLDGKLIATAFASGRSGEQRGLEIHGWDAESAEARWTHVVSGTAPNPKAFTQDDLERSPDSRLLRAVLGWASGARYARGESVLIDAATGEERTRFTGTVPMAVSPDGREVAWADWVPASEQRDSEIRIRDLASGRDRLVLPKQSGYAAAFAYSPDGRQLATATMDGAKGRLTLWDASSGTLLRQFKLGHHIDAKLAFSSDGQRLAVASAESMLFVGGLGDVRLFDLAAGVELPPLHVNARGPYFVGFSPDDKRILTASGSVFSPSTELRLWDAISGRELLLLTFRELANEFQFRDNNTRLIAFDGIGLDFGAVQVWDGTPRD